jgi:hypothetical protein
MSSTEFRVSNFTKRVVGFIVGRPVVALLLGLGLVAGAMAGLPRVKADFTHRGFFWDDDPYLMQFDAFERQFGNDDAVVVAVHSPSGVFDMETATLVARLTERMWQIPEVIRVDSLANYNWVHADGDEIKVEPLFPAEVTPEVLAARKKVALSHEVIPNYLVSKDATTALLFGRIKPGIDKPPDSGLITRSARKLVDEHKGGDHTFYVTGGPPINFAFEEVATHDLGRLLPTAILVAAIFLVLALRSVFGVVLPIVVMLMTVAATFGFAGWSGMVLNTMSTAIPSILLAACIADTVHILVTFYQDLKAGRDRKTAARQSLELNFQATFLTAFTTSLGFAGFTAANLKPIAAMGYMAAFGAMLAWVLTYLVVGSLLVILPIKAGRVGPESAALDRRLAHRWVEFLARNRGTVMVVAAVVTLASGALAAGSEVNADPFKYFQKSVPIRVSNEFIEDRVGGARGIEIVIESGREDGIKDGAFLQKVDQLQSWIAEIPEVTRALSLVDILKSVNRSLNGDRPDAYSLPHDRETIAQELFLYTMSLPQGMDLNDRVTIKNDALRMTILNRIPTSRENVEVIERIEAKARSMGLVAHATGKFSLYQRTNGYVVNAFLWSFFTSLFSISFVMMLFLRSVKLGLVAMIPNVLPIVVGGAVLKLIGQPLDMGTVLIGAVCLGIAVDDTIHVLANFRRLRGQDMPARDAMKAVLAHAGRPLLATTAILVISFGSFLQADFTPNLYFGVLTAVVLGIALLTDFTVTCAMLIGGTGDASTAKGTPVPADGAAWPAKDVSSVGA